VGKNHPPPSGDLLAEAMRELAAWLDCLGASGLSLRAAKNRVVRDLLKDGIPEAATKELLDRVTAKLESILRRRDGDPNPKVLAAVKKARKKPRVLTREETVKFITRPINFGPPEPLPAGKAGPRTKRTQYDAARDRRKGRYHRLKVLPTAGGKRRREIGDGARDKRRELVLSVAREIPAIPKYGRIKKIQRALYQKKKLRLDRHIIGDILKTTRD
jgi:hypothetical protein